ncbi:MAG: hypothetical protein IPM37_22865 [Hahellaceae bacterium]|nr:hypothetical protein [Hahellaceae bacterium]
MRSNLSVAPPFDLLIYGKDKFEPAHVLHLKLNSPCHMLLSPEGRGEGIMALFNGLPPLRLGKRLVP